MLKRFFPILCILFFILTLIPLANADMPGEVGVTGGTTGSDGGCTGSGCEGGGDSSTFPLTGGSSYFWVTGVHSSNTCTTPGNNFYDNTVDPGFTGTGDVHWSLLNNTAWGNPLSVSSISVVASGTISAGGGWAVVSFTVAGSGTHTMSDMTNSANTGAATGCSSATMKAEYGWAKNTITCSTSAPGCSYTDQLFSFVNNKGGAPVNGVFSYITIGAAPAVEFSNSYTLSPLSRTELIGRWTAQTNATYYKAFLGFTGLVPNGATFPIGTYAGNTTRTNFAFNNLLNTPDAHCSIIQAYDNTNTLLATSNEACATPLQSNLNFTGNTTRVVPDNVSVTITRGLAADYYVDCVRIDSAGSVGNACTADGWLTDSGNTYNFRYHQSLPTNTTTGDVGQYLLYVVNSTGAYLGGVPFCIKSTWASGCNVTVGSDLAQQLGSSTITEVAGIINSNNEALNQVQEVTVQNYFVGFLATLFRTDVFIPNILWGYIIAIFICAVGVGTNMRRG